MVAKIVELYTRPVAMAEFVRHYKEIHFVLLDHIPGMSRYIIGKVMTEAPWFLTVEIFFPDMAALTAAMRSEQWALVDSDLESFAAGLMTRLLVEEQDD